MKTEQLVRVFDTARASGMSMREAEQAFKNLARSETKPEAVTIRSPRAEKVRVARETLNDLSNAIRMEDWNAVQTHAALIEKLACWLKQVPRA